MSEAAENLPAPKILRNRRLIVKRSRVPTHIKNKMEQAKERQERALELRKARVPYRVIAEQLGYAGPAGAKKAVDAAIRRHEYEAARDVVLLDLQTLDELQMRATEALRRGDLFQIDRILRVMQQRYQLLGVSSRTVEELQEHMGVKSPTQIQNNGVMIVQGGTSDFVRSMMQAVGVDPESPEAQKKLLELESAESPSRTVKIPKRKKSAGTGGTHTGGSSIGGSHTPPSYTELDEDEIIDAEIVEDDETQDVSDAAKVAHKLMSPPSH